MFLNSLNSVQKAINLKRSQKWEIKCNVQLLLRQLQTSEHRFRAISALISAASPEKMDRYTNLRTTSGTININYQSGPHGDHKYRGDPLY